MATLTRQVKRLKGVGKSSPSRFLQEREYEAVNAEALRGIVSYLQYLYSEGEISDKAYKALVSQALYTFVENSVQLKVEQTLNEVSTTLQEANEVLLNKILL